MMEQRSFEVRFLEGKVRRLEREISKLREQGERLLDKTLELGTENDKLREERDTYRDLVGCMVHPDVPDQLYSENVKLRELVRDMYACISHANEADWFYFERDKLGCGMSCTVNGESCGLCALADRMREVGVEP